MKGYFRTIKASFYKFSHSKIVFVHVVIPLLAVITFGGYYSYSPWSLEDKLSVYLQAAAMAYPFLISAMITIAYEQEMNAGGFQNMLSTPYRRRVSHMGILIALLGLGVFSCLLTVMGLGTLLSVITGAPFLFSFYIRTFLLLFLANVSLYLMEYMICFSFGHGVCLATGIIGTLFSPLLLMGMGDAIWYYIPFSYGARISMYSIYKWFQQDFYEAIKQDFGKGITSSAIITVLLFVLFFFWSDGWQGRTARQG